MKNKCIFKVLSYVLLIYVTVVGYASAGTLYMPEGYVAEGIDEFVGVLNTNDEAAKGQCRIYYDDGTKLEVNVTFPGKQRGGLTVKDLGVELNKSYSIVIETDLDICATMIRYDHGRAMGANFTPTTSKEWSIAEGYISDKHDDYLSIFNPNEETVEVAVKALSTYWSDYEFTIRVGGMSRGSLPMHEYINEDSWNRTYGLVINADKNIVASLSHYDDNLGDGTLMMAHPSQDGGGSSGFVAEGWVSSNNGYEWVSILNPHPYSVYLDFTIHYNDGISQTYDNVWVANYSRLGYALHDVVNLDEGYVVEYEAYSVGPSVYSKNAPEVGTPVSVIANFSHFDLDGLNGTQFYQTGKKHWEFAEGYRSYEKGLVKEYLLIYNPSDKDTSITVTLMYDDGINPTEITMDIARKTKSWIALHDDDRIRDREENGGIWYGITIDSVEKVIPYFTHYDLTFGGSFALNGTGRN